MNTERFTFFAHTRSVFSQWNETAPFDLHGIRFKTAENYMMWRKGLLFGADQALLDRILAADAREAKALGRDVPNFDQKVWDLMARPIVRDGNYGKFSQNDHAMDALLATEGTTLVEAASWDRIWGIGLSADDPRAMQRETWQGTNWLGEVLTEVRDTFLAAERIWTKRHDPRD